MALEVRVSGAATLRRVAAQMRTEGSKDLSKAMSRALSKATDPLRESIRASALETMPHEMGYAAVFDKSLRFRLQQRGGGQSATVTLVTYADGTSERRDIKRLEAGTLRHPVFGRSSAGNRKGERRAHPWAVTSIRAGFHKRGTASGMDHAEKAMSEVVQDYAQRLIE